MRNHLSLPAHTPPVRACLVGLGRSAVIYTDDPMCKMSAHAADRVERRRHGRTGALGMWPVGSRELCRPGTEAEGKLVTESDLSLRAPAQSSRLIRCAWHF